MKEILITGGCGYIGSHTAVQAIAAGYKCVIIDNLCNSDITVLKAISLITGKSVSFYQADVQNSADLKNVFSKHSIDAVIHFAGLKSVSESQQFPLRYYDNNVSGTITLLNVMLEFDVKRFIFSSSATVYGNPGTDCYTEALPLTPINTYGRTKAIVEQILKDLHRANPDLRIVNLRYFNPVGAHKSGLIGDSPKGIPNNLMPFITQVASGKLNKLTIYGNDYHTPDGTGMRDYIHVEDLANGHLLALQKLSQQNQLLTLNLGTGKPYSVLDMIACFEKVSGKKISYQFAPRRPGDLSSYYANPELAKKILGWSAQHDLKRMCADAWHFESMRNSL